ncbi:MAG: hypothetical protein JWQ49_6550 [Edaphobacter sp.]|nr:hypothetical protein [Edaphobacter sp.]
MKNSEEALEKVLAGLRDAEAAIGMERRILDGLLGLEERGAARPGSGWRRWLPIWMVVPGRPVAVASLVCGAALAGLFAVALAIPTIRRLGHGLVQARRSVTPVGSLALGTSETAAKSARPASSGSGVPSRAEIKGNGTGKVEGKGNVGSQKGVLGSDAVALEDMHAASRPAPPMPLTEQEKLLLRLVHKDAPVELAMLGPKARALQDLEDKAEFQRFFGQSMKQAAPEQSVTEQGVPQQSAREQVAPGQSDTSSTEQAMPAQPGTEGATSEQPLLEQAVPEQPTQQPSTPEKFAPDRSITQQARPRTTRTTGESE